MKLVNQQLIKNTNLKLLYNSVFHNRGISRADLARRTGLSRTAVSALVDELSETGFLRDAGSTARRKEMQRMSGGATLSSSASENASGARRKAGRKPNCLELCAGNYYVLVFGWEADCIQVHLADISGAVSRHEEIGRGASDSYIRLCQAWLDGLLASTVTKQQLLGICFVLPAMLDPAERTAFSTAVSLEYDGGGEGVFSRLQEAFSEYAVAVLNDTACAAYAEKVYTGVTEKDFAFIRFDRGIGAALFIQDRLLGDACASHTQFGHFSISPDGPPCACGNRGCLEMLLREDRLPERLPQKDIPLTYESLGQSALYGDTASMQTIRDMAFEFSLALANLVCLVHPSLIVLGGRIRRLGPFFLEEVRRALAERSFHKMTDTLRLRYSILDSNACYNGAMKYFFDRHYQFTADMEHTFFIG